MRNLPRRLAVFMAAAMSFAAFTVPPSAASPPRPVSVQLLSITDLHGYLRPPAPAEGGVIPGRHGATVTVGGVAYLATHLKRLQTGHRNTAFFATGDSFSGWPFEVAAHANEPTIEILNKLGLRFSAVGNHELDVSPGFLVGHMEHGRCFGTIGEDSCFTDSTGRLFHGADFDFQSANIVSARTGRTTVAPYRVEWFKGPGGRRLPVGFIGMTVPGTPVSPTSYQPGLRALDVVATADRYAAELRRKGVRAIVLNLHDGAEPRESGRSAYDACDEVSGPAMDVARKVSPDIDAVVTGHWHTRFNCFVNDPAGHPRPVVEAGSHGELINEIDLSLDPRTGEVLRDRTRSVNHAVTRDVPPDPQVQRIVDYWTEQGRARYAQPLAELTDDITRTPNAAGESTAADLYADVEYWDANRDADGHGGHAGHARHADLALIAAGAATGDTAVRGDLHYAAGSHPDDADGRILLGEAWKAFGYGDPILTVGLTGAQLHAILEQQWRTRDDGSTVTAPLAVSRNVVYGYDPSRPVGDRIDPWGVLIDGRPLDLRRVYRVAALAYTVIGSDGYSAFTGYTHPVRCDTDHWAFLAYLKAHPEVSPAPLDRVRVNKTPDAAAGLMTE